MYIVIQVGYYIFVLLVLKIQKQSDLKFKVSLGNVVQFCFKKKSKKIKNKDNNNIFCKIRIIIFIKIGVYKRRNIQNIKEKFFKN